jgi:hypothetical protein
MAKSVIGVGTTANDGTGDTLRAAGVKINDNFSEIYNALGTGSAITLTSSVAELNYVDGVTSAIQTQLDAKAASSSLATVATSGSYTDLSSKPTIPTASSLSVDDLISLSGVAEGSANLGTFTGTTIADNQTIKQGLQALETSVEGKQASITTTLTLTVSTSVPATPANGMFAVADGNTAGWDPKGTNAGVSYPVFYNGSSWTALY